MIPVELMQILRERIVENGIRETCRAAEVDHAVVVRWLAGKGKLSDRALSCVAWAVGLEIERTTTWRWEDVGTDENEGAGSSGKASGSHCLCDSPSS